MPNKPDTPAVVEIETFKGFDQDFKCRGMQYVVGETVNHAGVVRACSSGLHSCENPADVLYYYPLTGGNRFAVVKASGTIGRHADDSKIASASLQVVVELSVPEYIRRVVSWIVSAATTTLTDGDYAHAASTGDYAHAASTGDYAHAASTGDYAISCSIGAQGTATAGATGAIVLAYYDDTVFPAKLIRVAAFMVGEKGVEAGKTYKLDAEGKPVETAARTPYRG